jgi:hypothetical protein
MDKSKSKKVLNTFRKFLKLLKVFFLMNKKQCIKERPTVSGSILKLTLQRILDISQFSTIMVLEL